MRALALFQNFKNCDFLQKIAIPHFKNRPIEHAKPLILKQFHYFTSLFFVFSKINSDSSKFTTHCYLNSFFQS